MTAIQRSAIAELHEALERANVREHPFLRQLSVWMRPGMRACLGVSVPGSPGTFAGSDPAILRLGPDECLVVATTDHEPALRGVPECRAVVDVSDQRTTFELHGPRAREILAGGCSIDLHPRAFAPGRCAETTLARTGVILIQLDDAPTYRLLVRRSFAVYAATWLLDAMNEPV